VKKVGTRSTASVTPEPRKRVPDNSPGLGGEGSRAPILPGVTVPKKYISASSLPSFSFVKSLLKKSVSRPLRLGVRSHPWLNSPFPFLRLDLFRVFRAFRGSSVSPSSLPSFPSVKSLSRPLRLGVRSHPWLKIPLRISNFVILSSFGLRHSSFHLPLLRSLLLKQFVLFSSHSWLNSPFPFLRLDPFRAFRAFRGSALPPKNWTQMLGFERTKL
jgi:hypothetical protein